MPVRNLADRPRMPRVGKLHLGVREAKEGKPSFPRAVDFFVCRTDETTPAESDAAFKEQYGDTPRELTIIFPSDDPKYLPDPWLKAYGQSHGLVCKGDGETASAKWDNARDGERPPGVEKGTWASGQTEIASRQEIPCLHAECVMFKSKRCRMVLNFQFMLPDVKVVGLWQIDTGSFWSVTNLTANVMMLRELFGQVRGIPLKLRLVSKTVRPEGGKSKNVFVLDLAMPGISPRELVTMKSMLPVAALPAPIDDNEMPDDLMPGVVDAEGTVVMSPEEVEQAEQAVLHMETAMAEEAEQAIVEIPEGTPVFATAGDLLNYCHATHGLDSARVLELLVFHSVDDLVTLAGQSPDGLRLAYAKVLKKLQASQAGESA